MNPKNLLHLELKFSILIIILTFFLLNFMILTKSDVSIKRLGFLAWGDERSDFASLMTMGTNGEFLQNSFQATGSIAWSKDGKFLAMGCRDISKICIYDVDNLGDFSKIPPLFPDESSHKELPLPYKCKGSISDRGIDSISWSKDGTSLLVVCENLEKSNICIINMDKTNYCWKEKFGYDIYSRAEWSPKNNNIVIDTGLQCQILPEKPQNSNGTGIICKRTGRKMEIVDSFGKTITSLIDGWSPSWSPDGEEIAFFRWDDERGYAGLAKIRNDGREFTWIYRPPKRGEDSIAEHFKLGFSHEFSPWGSSKITWSGDKKFLFVGAMYINESFFSIFKIDIESGKVINLITNPTQGSLYQEVSLQP